MGPSNPAPTDELVFYAANLVEDLGGIHSNTVLPYFSHSPFYDSTSNNASLTTQATYNPSMVYLLQTREAFEGRLRSMQGVEFVVAAEPQPPPTPEGETGAWIIHKQNRKKRAGQDEIEVLSSYFIVNDHIFMAPSISSVIGTRILSAMTSMKTLLGTAASFPTFSPAMGHSYPRMQEKSGPKTKEAATTESMAASPTGDSISKSTQESVSGLNSKPDDASTLAEALLIADSFQTSLRYKEQYMDEQPLMGEPGSFVLSAAQPPSGSIPDIVSKQDAAQTRGASKERDAHSVAPSQSQTPQRSTSVGLDAKRRGKSKAAGTTSPKGG